MVRTAGSKSFTTEDTSLLLDIVEKLRPFTKIKWDEVAQAFNDHASENNMATRDADALKRRFMVLAYGKKSADNWQDSILRAMQLHHSILAENGELDQPPRLSIGGPGGMVTADHSDHMLLLQDDDSGLPTYDEDGSTRLTPRMTPVPLRTGKRGRPLGSTTGAAAKRMQKQAEQVAYLLSAVTQLQEQMREVREALATIVDTQSNQTAIISALQHHLDIHGEKLLPIGGTLRVEHEDKSEQEELSKQLREAAKAALDYQVVGSGQNGASLGEEDEEEEDEDDEDDDDEDNGTGEDDSYNVSSEANYHEATFEEMLAD